MSVPAALKNGTVITLENGGYFCCDDFQWGWAVPSFKCNRNFAGGWEQFTVTVLSNNTIALKGGNLGKYCTDNGGPMAQPPELVQCNRDVLGPWEKFMVWSSAANTIALMSGRTGRYCAYDYGRNLGVQCNEVQLSSRTTFTLKVVSTPGERMFQAP